MAHKTTWKGIARVAAVATMSAACFAFLTYFDINDYFGHPGRAAKFWIWFERTSWAVALGGTLVTWIAYRQSQKRGPSPTVQHGNARPLDESLRPNSIEIPAEEPDGKRIRGRSSLIADLLTSWSWRGRRKPRVRVLHGLGGGGKTAVAAVVAHRASKKGISVWWVSAASPAQLNSGLRQVALELGASQGDIEQAWSGVTSASDLLWRYLSKYQGRWMLVIDNADDPDMLAARGCKIGENNGWVRNPPKGGFLLLTSREGDPRRWASWCGLQHLHRLDLSSAAEMLLDHSGGLGGDRSEAELLADRLGRLPLALKLAGSYLSDVAATPVPGAITTFAMYREALDAGNVGVLDSQNDSGDSETAASRRIVRQTWYLSIELLEKRGLTYSRDLIHLLSRFADAPIPYTLLLDPALLGMTPRFQAIRPEALVHHIRALAHVGLLDLMTNEGEGEGGKPAGILGGLKSLHMHPVVRDVGRAESVDELELSGLASALLALAVEKAGEESAGDPAHWPLWETLTPHVVDLAVELLSADPPDPRLVMMIGSSATLVGRSLRVIGHLWLAEFLLVVALRLIRSQPTELHERIRSDLQRELAIVFIDQGRSDDASEILKEARREAEGRGGDIIQLLGLRHEMAITLADAGRLDEAENEFRVILEASRDAGAAPSSFDGMAVQFELAGVLIRKEEWAEAEELLQTVLKNSVALGGERSELTISTYFKLGSLFRRKGDPQAASRHLDAALEGARVVYLPDSPLTLAIRHERALLLAATGNEKEAASELESVVNACRRTMGDDHPSTQASIQALGELRRR